MIPVDYLQSVPLLAGLDEVTSQWLAGAMIARSFKPQELVIEQGSKDADLIFLLKGCLQVLETSSAGRDIGLTTIYEGDFLGELAVIDGLPRSASVMAVGPSVVLIMPNAQARQFLFEHRLGSERMMQRLAARIRQSSANQTQALMAQAPQRILSVLRAMAEPQQDGSLLVPFMPTQAQLAVMANLARETVARALGDLRRRGIISASLNRRVTLYATTLPATQIEPPRL
jgi:CRP/FNR family cyclic AMP-dependent transcriptional regulator